MINPRLFRQCCLSYEEAIERLDTAKMWQMYVETLLVLFENDVIRPRIRLRLYDTCQKALTGKKLLINHVLEILLLALVAFGTDFAIKHAT